jgi:hypothetical protein
LESDFHYSYFISLTASQSPIIDTAAATHGREEEIMARTNGNGSVPRTKSKSAKKLSTHEKIALRAYEIYLERNGAPGNPLEDWVRAESEIAALAAKPKRAAKKAIATAA